MQRHKILGKSTTSVIKWMAKNDYTMPQVLRVVANLSTPQGIKRTSILTAFNDGRNPDYNFKGVAHVSASDQIKLEQNRDEYRDGAPRATDEPAAPRNRIARVVADSEAIGVNRRLMELQSNVDALRSQIEVLEKRTPIVKTIELKLPNKPVKTLKNRVHPIFEEVLFHVNCKDNVMLVGPKGCGKTRLAEDIAKALGYECGLISLSGGVTESKLLGRVTPNIRTGENEYHPALFIELFERGGLFLLDEIDAADPNVVLSLNSAFSNGYIAVDRKKNPVVNRHEDFICMAAANTWGNGADRQYVGRNQQDAAFTERFVQIEMDYDKELEFALCPGHVEMVEELHAIRARVQQNRLERTISTRFILRATNWMQHGKDMGYCLDKLFAGWRADEIRKAKGGL